jgi:citrate lyase synthetase
MNVSVIWHLFSACELIHIFVCKDKTALIMLKILCGLVQNVLDRVPRVCVHFVHRFVVIEKKNSFCLVTQN